ncbi:MAG: hypothetical protein M3Z25_03355 [Actinomycetota bacterium]|nr:hypothetical protein [Actinomycetota bacterium]
MYCADGPLLTGALAGADPATDPGIAGWLLAQVADPRVAQLVSLARDLAADNAAAT